MIELAQQIRHVDGRTDVMTIEGILFSDGSTLHYDSLVTEYEEYIDPKDIEIKRLLGIIKDLENPSNREPRKRRRSLDEGEIKEIKELIELKNYIPDIAKEYDVSVSAIYRIGRDLKDMK